MTASPKLDNICAHEPTIQHRGQDHVRLKPLSTPRAPLHLVVQEGQLQVHTAPYRGSFSGVLSEAIRSAGLGRRVMVAQFLKGGVNQGPNGVIQLCGRLKWLRPDVSTCLSNEHIEACSEGEMAQNKNAVEEIWAICQESLLKEDLDQLVLDEIGLAIALGYLKEFNVLNHLEKRPESMDVILTGPLIPPRIMSIADQVTELRSGF